MYQKIFYSSFWEELQNFALRARPPHQPRNVECLQIAKPAIDINQPRTGTGPLFQTAVVTEIVDIFLYSKCLFHFYFSEEEGCCCLLSNMQSTLDISRLLILLNFLLLEQRDFGVMEVITSVTASQTILKLLWTVQRVNVGLKSFQCFSSACHICVFLPFASLLFL